MNKEEARQEPVAWLPSAEWTACVKLPITVHVRQQRPGETHVSTREGITPVKPDDLIMRGVSGEEYPIGREIFDRTYRVGEAHPAPVNTALLEKAAELACDAVAFNGGSVQMEAHVRAALEAAVLAQGDMSPASTHGKNVSMKQGFEDMNEAKQEPVAWMIWLHGPAGLFEHKQTAELEFEKRNSDYPDQDRKLTALYTHPAPVNQQLLEQFELVLRNLDKGMSKSIQKLVARESREVLAAIAVFKGEAVAVRQTEKSDGVV